MMESIYDINESPEKDEDAKSEIKEDAENTVADDVDPDGEPQDHEKDDSPDYEAIMASDIALLKAEFPELKDVNDITELNNPLRYAALRDLGLSPSEAYMATAKRRVQDTRSHLRSAHGRNASGAVGMMSQRELQAARELFPDRSDAELQRLYKRVT